MEISLRSPAKVNLFLRVLGKRSDGYHNVATLLHVIDIYDTLTIALSKEDSVACSKNISGTNIATKAVDLFRRKSGLKFSVSIFIEKKIPIRAGLGGGSSNAASVLMGLNQLFNFPFSREELQTISAEIGSDVPFFFSSGVAYCTGRGEIVKDLPGFFLKQKIKVYAPKDGLSTPEVYGAVDISLCHKMDPEELLKSFLQDKPLLVNDLEIPAFKLMPHLKQVKQKFSATMSGSGSAFFWLC